jgi:hypothetical protein
VRWTFPPIDEDTILKIKLSSRRPADFLAWRHESNGCFTLRSAYKLGLRLSQQGLAFATSSDVPLGDKAIWKLIWQCKIPLKLKIFAWKALAGGLATELNKHRRHIPISGGCRVCGHGHEDTFHALLTCPHAAVLWAAMWEVWDIHMWGEGGREDWIEQWLLHMPMGTCDRVLMISWRVCFARIEVTHDS